MVDIDKVRYFTAFLDCCTSVLIHEVVFCALFFCVFVLYVMQQSRRHLLPIVS